MKPKDVDEGEEDHNDFDKCIFDVESDNDESDHGEQEC